MKVLGHILIDTRIDKGDMVVGFPERNISNIFFVKAAEWCKNELNILHSN